MSCAEATASFSRPTPASNKALGAVVAAGDRRAGIGAVSGGGGLTGSTAAVALVGPTAAGPLAGSKAAATRSASACSSALALLFFGGVLSVLIRGGPSSLPDTPSFAPHPALSVASSSAPYFG